MQISQRASEKIPELQDAFGTSAVTLANLLYPWWGWLGTSCFSTFNYFAVASLSEVSPTLHVGVCARNWVCISPSLSSSLDLNGKDHLRLSGLLLELLHTHSEMLLQHSVSRSWMPRKYQLLSGSLSGLLPIFLHCPQSTDCQWPNAQLQQDQDTSALTLSFQWKQLISNSFISQTYSEKICYSKREKNFEATERIQEFSFC